MHRYMTYMNINMQMKMNVNINIYMTMSTNINMNINHKCNIFAINYKLLLIYIKFLD